MNKYSHKVASGLRAMKKDPQAFLFCSSDGIDYNKGDILGFPVFYTSLIQNTTTDENIPFIPIWDDENDYIVEIKRFNNGYCEEK